MNKKIISLLLCATLILGVFGCNNKTSQETENSHPSPNNTVEDVLDVKYDYSKKPTLHKVNVENSQREFVVNGKSDYKIVVQSGNQYIVKSATFIMENVKACTGVGLPIEDSTKISAINDSDKLIVIGCKNLFTSAGLTMPKDKLGESGYYLKTQGNNVFIMCEQPFGYQMGAIAFLRHTLGYDMYASNMVGYSKDGKTIPNMEIIERPDFDYRHWSNMLDQNALYGMGYSTHENMLNVEGQTVHNAFGWLPKEEHYKNNPEWYADSGEQLCFTAHGNKQSLQKMINTVYEKMIKLLEEQPEANIVSISQMDNRDFCQCEHCQEIYRKYGNLNGATIPFLNEVADKVDAYMTQKAEKEGTAKRDILIEQFAYSVYTQPPVKKNEKGEVVPIDESVICRDNVGIQIAPVLLYFNQPLDTKENHYGTDITDWGVLTNNITYWLYETNFRAYLIPYNSWDNMVGHYRYARRFGDKYMFNEGQLGQTNGTGFTKLKDYIDSKAQFDVNVDYMQVCNNFFDGYFMEASKPMRNYFDKLQAYFEYLEQTYPKQFNGETQTFEPENVKYWPKGLMDDFMSDINQAYDAIEVHKNSNPKLYNNLKNNINLESIFPRYILCQYHSGNYSSSQLASLRKEFKADCQKLGITRLSEHVLIDALFAEWGI